MENTEKRIRDTGNMMKRCNTQVIRIPEATEMMTETL